MPDQTRVWVDETYIEYAGEGNRRAFAARRHNVMVCKSMSKVYALSNTGSVFMRCAGNRQFVAGDHAALGRQSSSPGCGGECVG